MVERADFPFLEGLMTRRRKLEQAIASSVGDRRLEGLLREVEDALERLDNGTFGVCEVCQDSIEPVRLVADPCVRVCLDHLSPDQQEDLEEDLSVASRIQEELLPEHDLHAFGWDAAYHYQAARVVSGDYCDLLSFKESFYFIVGDVSGKGVSAAMLMTHLHATFRALVSQCLPLEEIMERASRMFCESTLPTHFATLALGKANASGDIDLCIAGHVPVLVIRDSDIGRIEATGFPLGMFCDERFSVTKTRLAPGESIVLYTDGLNESEDPTGQEYGIDRLANLLEISGGLPPQEIIASCLADLESFRSGTAMHDDLTIMVLRRSAIAAS
jgi:sigma-B regulation protein RsbU (phosphoserine phosphatase)